jgi:hypothetical protein
MSGVFARHATSRSARGFFAATNNKVRAAPDGARRPCSHSCRVRTETPSRRANTVWDRPVFSRMLATEGRVVTRPCSPRLISRIPSRISRPMSLFRLAIYLVLDLFQGGSGNLCRHILGIQRKQPDLALLRSQVVNNSKSAPLSSACRAPAQFSNATRLPNEIPSRPD